MSRATLKFKTGLGIFTLILMVKGLGGTFNEPLNRVGLGLYHGPIVAFLFSFPLTLYFLLPFSLSNKPKAKRQHRLLIIPFFILLAFGAFIRFQAIKQSPLDPSRADMLPAIESEIRAFLSGTNPYGPIPMSDGRIIQHGYPPMLWLTFLPFYVLGCDIRVFTILFQIFFYCLLLYRYVNKKRDWFQSPWLSGGLFLGLISLHLFSKLSLKQVVDIHTAPFSFYLCLVLLCYERKWWRGMGFFAACLLATREPAFLLLIPLAISFHFQDRAGFMKVAYSTILCLTFILLPFIIGGPKEFFSGIFFYAQHIYANTFEDMIRFYGFSGLLLKWDSLWLQKPLQLLGVGIPILLAWIRRKTIQPDYAIGLGALSLLGLMLFVSLSYQFVFNEIIVVLFYLILSEEDSSKVKRSIG